VIYTKLSKSITFSVFSILFFSGTGISAKAQTALDRSLAPDENHEVSNVFRDMGVVQRKAMNKANRFLIANYGSLDFSDGPYSMYGFNLNLGYALSDFWEIYITSTPFFITNPRSIVAKVAELEIRNPDNADVPLSAEIGMVRPKFQYGGELVWAPAYGKDSVGTRRVIRSDTFFKIGVMQTLFENADKGLKFHLGVGKTYFLNSWWGFRLTASANYLETIIESGVEGNLTSSKNFGFFAIVEAGFVFYL